jgi:hypothetical protein
MNPVIKVAIAGGIIAVLALIHNVVDVIFQNHAEAMVKHNNPKVRAKHCLIYTLGFVPLMWYFDFTFWEWMIALNTLFWSHFCEDTYIPVYLWAKYIRRPPEMVEPWKETYTRVDGSVAVKVHPPDPKRGFGEWIQSPLGKILMIWVDQIVHWIFLVPIAIIAMRHLP